MTGSNITLTEYATRWGKIFSPGEMTALNFALSEYGEDGASFFELLASICQTDTLIVDTCPEIGLLARASDDWVIPPYRYVACPSSKLNDPALRANEAPLDASRYVRMDSVEDFCSEFGRFDPGSNSVVAIADDITDFERLYDRLPVDQPDFRSTFILRLGQPQWLDEIRQLNLGRTHSMFGFAAPRFNPYNWRGQETNAYGDAHDIYVILTTNRELVESTKFFHPLPTSRKELVETSFENGGISVRLTTSANIADFLDTVPRYSSAALARVRTIGATHLRALKYYSDRTGVPDLIPREVQDVPRPSESEHPPKRRNDTRIFVRSKSLLRPRNFLRLGRTKGQYERGPHARNSIRQRIKQILAAPLHFFIGIPAADWSTEFDEAFYEATVNGLADSRLSPIDHFIIYGFVERRPPNPRALFLSEGEGAPEQVAESLIEFNKAVQKSFQASNRMLPLRISVLVPVYDDLHATKACLESVIRSRTANRVQLDVVVVEDSTPNPLIREYLEGLVLEGQITLYRTPRNLGFTGACNLALSEIDTDVILLNSDTAVFNDWADRLMFTAHVHERIATVTATSNHGSICTIPNPVDNRGVTSVIQAEVIDDQLSRLGNRIDSIRPIPTAVGHCVYIKRNVLQEVGLLDDLEFNRGYGEEVDFSLRATSCGYIHVQAGSVYVWHQGGASFGSQKQVREFNADRKLLRLYPFYYATVARFVETFPSFAELYSAAALALRSDLGRCRLFISHDLGGGADQVVTDRATQLIQGGITPLILRLSISGGFTLEKPSSEAPPTVLLATPHANQADLAGFISNLDVEMIEIHEAVFRLHDLIELLHVWPFPYQITIHDYYYICPQINLTTSTGEYCGEPGPSECFRCLTERPRPDGTDIVAFRRRSERLLTGAQRITSPSIDTSARVSKYFPKLRIEVEPHHEAKPGHKSLERWRDAWPTSKRIRVATLGVVALHKGGARLRNLIALANSLQLPIDFYVIGPTIEEFSDIPSTGAYRPDELPTLAHLADPDVILFLSDFPETFSFTFSEAVRLDLPIMAPNWGAFTERAREARRCTLFDRASTPLQLLEMLITFATTDLESASVRQSSEDTSATPSELDTLLTSRSIKHRTRPDKLRIALFGEGTPLYPTASAEIRFLRPLNHPALKDAVEITTHSALAPDHVEADIFILQRLAAGKVSLFERIVQDAQRVQAKLIWDIDDALFLINEDHPEYEYYGRFAELLSVLEGSVDAITVSTSALEHEFLTRSTRPVVRYPNFIDEQLIRTFAEVRPSWYRRFSSSDNMTVKAVYMGTPTHEGDLSSGLREFAQGGLGRHGCLEILGAIASFDEAPNMYAQYIHALNYEEFMLRFVNSRRWQVGIAPLQDNKFNRYKSAIKYFDYALAGIPAVYSNVGEYPKYVRSGENGLLARNEDEFVEQWRTLMNDVELRNHLASNAYRDVMNSHSVAVNADNILSIFSNLTTVGSRGES